MKKILEMCCKWLWKEQTGNEFKMLQQNKCNFNTPTKSVFQKENLSNGGSDSLKKILLKSTTWQSRWTIVLVITATIISEHCILELINERIANKMTKLLCSSRIWQLSLWFFFTSLRHVRLEFTSFIQPFSCYFNDKHKNKNRTQSKMKKK